MDQKAAPSPPRGNGNNGGIASPPPPRSWWRIVFLSPIGGTFNAIHCLGEDGAEGTPLAPRAPRDPLAPMDRSPRCRTANTTQSKVSAMGTLLGETQEKTLIILCGGRRWKRQQWRWEGGGGGGGGGGWQQRGDRRCPPDHPPSQSFIQSSTEKPMLLRFSPSTQIRIGAVVGDTQSSRRGRGRDGEGHCELTFFLLYCWEKRHSRRLRGSRRQRLARRCGSDEGGGGPRLPASNHQALSHLVRDF